MRSRRVFSKAEAHRKNAAWARAEAAYLEALALDPTFGLAHLGLADVLAHTGGADKRRRTHLATALVDLPENPRAHESFADVLAATDDLSGALLHLRCALELKPQLAAARRRAARIALLLNGPSAAKPILLPLVEGRPKAQDWILVSDVRAAEGQREAAALAMERAAKEARSAALFRRAARLWEEADVPERSSLAKATADALDPPKQRRKLRSLPPARVRRR